MYTTIFFDLDDTLYDFGAASREAFHEVYELLDYARFFDSFEQYMQIYTPYNLELWKGSMQSILSLARYGYSGALKLTTAMYYPAKGNGYDGVGIVPDDVVELSEEAAGKNIYELEDQHDNQLIQALKHFQ